VINRCGSLLLVAASLGACGEDNGVDYCKNHYAYHSDHQDSVASLTIKLSEAGDLDGKLAMPDIVIREIADADVSLILGDVKNTFALQTETPCEVRVESISPTAEGLEANFKASCGLDNKIGQIDVVLFDHLEALEEVVVSVTTPATSKRFGISRQCDGPIFRLE
jgi:hypothetical protein